MVTEAIVHEMDIKVTKEIIDMIENETVVLVDDSVPIIEIDDDDYDHLSNIFTLYVTFCIITRIYSNECDE